jgi:simple sugar transport system substrate-binding protein
MHGRWIPLSLLFMCASTFAAHGQAADDAASSKPAAPHRLKLVFVTCCVDQAFFVPVKKGMHDAAKMMDVDCDFIGTKDVDLPAQAKMVSQAVAEGYDGIAVNLIDATAFDEAVAAAIAKGVPVVAFNVDDSATPNARLASVNQRLYEAGRKVGEHALPDVPEGAHILLTKHDEGVSALEDRVRGIQDVLKKKNVTWTNAITGNDSQTGVDAITKALRENPDIRIILGSGQSDTEAAGRAIEAHFANQGYWSAGFDLSPKTLQLIQDGHIRFTIDQQPYVQGFYPVVELTLNLRYGIVPSDIDAGAGIVDRNNAEQIIDWTAQGYR